MPQDWGAGITDPAPLSSVIVLIYWGGINPCHHGGYSRRSGWSFLECPFISCSRTKTPRRIINQPVFPTGPELFFGFGTERLSAFIVQEIFACHTTFTAELQWGSLLLLCFASHWFSTFGGNVVKNFLLHTWQMVSGLSVVVLISGLPAHPLTCTLVLLSCQTLKCLSYT